MIHLCPILQTNQRMSYFDRRHAPTHPLASQVPRKSSHLRPTPYRVPVVVVPSLAQVTRLAKAELKRVKGNGWHLHKFLQAWLNEAVNSTSQQHPIENFYKSTHMRGDKLVPATRIDFFKSGPGRPPIFGLMTGTFEQEEERSTESEERGSFSMQEATPQRDDVNPKSDIHVEKKREVAFFEFNPPHLRYVFDDPAHM